MGQPMQLNIFGSVLALFGSILMGFKYISREKEHIEALSSATDALELMAGELESRSESLVKIIKYMEKHSRGVAREFYSYLMKQMDRLGEEEFDVLWNHAVDHELFRLSEEEQNEIMRLGNVLGRAELDNQVRLLRDCAVKMRSSLYNSKADFPQKKKLGLGLSAGAGLLFIIVLI